MRLTLGSQSFDLTTRALVMGTVARAGSVAGALAEGADIVEVEEMDAVTGGGAPRCVTPADDDALEAALAAGASLVRLGADASPAAYRRCAGAGVVVVVSDAEAAEAAGLPATRIVVDGGPAGGRRPVMIDVTGAACPLAATAAGVVRGARIVRTADVRGARRICDVLAAVWEAGIPGGSADA